jgi:hypothetical protein
MSASRAGAAAGQPSRSSARGISARWPDSSGTSGACQLAPDSGRGPTRSTHRKFLYQILTDLRCPASFLCAHSTERAHESAGQSLAPLPERL